MSKASNNIIRYEQGKDGQYSSGLDCGQIVLIFDFGVDSCNNSVQRVFID